LKLKGKTAVVTGGASGIGKAIAELFATEGASVHVVDLTGVESTRYSSHVCDTTNSSTVDRVVDGIAAQGPIHILANSVGMAHIGTVETTSPEDFDRIFQVNVKSFYHSMRASIRHMKQSGGGVIVNMASTAATIGIADRFAYSMSKGAVLSMTLSVAKDYLQHNIRCNCISPARVHTPFVDGYLKKNYPGREQEMYEKLSKAQPIGRMGRPEEVAALALFLCSDDAGFISGVDYPIDGGFFNLHN
jgi:2-keto-3-deoxy-L-fuconate dehydrogenase